MEGANNPEEPTMSTLDDSEDVISLSVDPNDVINALRTDELSDGSNVAMHFFRTETGQITKGIAREYNPSHSWPGEPPIILSPQAFVRPGWKNPATLVIEARREAKEEGEDPDEWEREVLEIWERETRVSLKSEIEVMGHSPEESKSICEIDYEAE